MNSRIPLTHEIRLTQAERATAALEDALLVGDLGLPPWLETEQTEAARIIAEAYGSNSYASSSAPTLREVLLFVPCLLVAGVLYCYLTFRNPSLREWLNR